MRCFVMALLAVAVLARVAAADDALDACKARRHAIATAAMQLATAEARAELYATMPECRVRDGGTTEVIEPPPSLVDTTPMPARFEVAVASGIAETGVFPGVQALASGPGPFVEIEGSTWIRKHLGVTVFASATKFSDASYQLLGAESIPVTGSITGQAPTFMPAPVTDNVYDTGARLDLRYGRMTVGAGLGVVIEHATEVVSYSDALLGLEVAVAARLGSVHGAAVELRAFATYAPIALTDVDTDEYALFSTRLALGLRY